MLNVVAHELAHQWFGNIVTLDWKVASQRWVTLEIGFFSRWDQMWLNEGFAEYVSNIASHYIDPEIHTWERFYVEETQWVMYQVVVGLIFRRNQKSTKAIYQDQDTRHHWAMTDPVTTRWPAPSFQLKTIQFASKG